LVGSLLAGFAPLEGSCASGPDRGIVATGGAGGGGGFDLRRDGVDVPKGVELAVAVENLMWHITHEAIEGLDAGLVGLHAGAVTAPGGGAVVLPAPSGSGKTTLTAGLVAAGWGYLTDELAILDPSGVTVSPFARPLCMSCPAIALIPGLGERLPSELDSPGCEKLQVRPDDLRPGALGQEAPVRAVVFPRYRPGAETVLQPMGRVETLVALLPNTFKLDRIGHAGLDTLAGLSRVAPGYQLVSGDLGEAVAAVERIAAAG